MRSKKVLNKGGCSKVESQMLRRCSSKSQNVQGQGERVRGNKQKSVGEEGKVVENEGEGIGDVVLRHQCTLEAVCSLNSDYRGNNVKFGSEVQAFCNRQSLRIGWREVPFLVYDVALLTGLPATGEHVTFDRGGSNRETKEKISMKKNFQMHGFAMILHFYEYTNLYAHTDDKCVPRIILPFLEVRELERREVTVKAFSETDDFNAYVEDAQERFRRTKEALWTAKKALRLDKEAHAATKKKLEYIRRG
ncbi:hypothetical protein Cgig2_008920 [Carnegiea gigantea]|uniref:Uncharacterized protein n=1 Tax=Carnegiea gigantea TaxID=171969 RepID=A0A9Q1GX96_9CARY|nr:hypothetical protein Cgig2_008920 [Carnegiea gigantea]